MYHRKLFRHPSTFTLEEVLQRASSHIATLYFTYIAGAHSIATAPRQATLCSFSPPISLNA